MNKPTPTRHGQWRVIDGQLVDESKIEQGKAVIASQQERVGGPGIAVPPIDEDAPDATESTTPSRRRSKASQRSVEQPSEEHSNGTA